MGATGLMNARGLSPRKGLPCHAARARRHLRSERGTAIVEFALIAPLLFLLVFGIIEFGRALNYYNDLTQLAGQGARAAIVNRNPDGTGVGTANADCAANNQTIQCQLAKTYPTDNELKNGMSVCLGTLNQATGQITAPASSPTIGSPITVRTKFPFHFLTTLFGATITLTSTQTERLEAPTTWQGGNVGAAGVDACSP
jgi:Flp pilus assembly protein TadG